MLNTYLVSVELNCLRNPHRTYSAIVVVLGNHVSEAETEIKEFFDDHDIKARTVHGWEVD